MSAQLPPIRSRRSCFLQDMQKKQDDMNTKQGWMQAEQKRFQDHANARMEPIRTRSAPSQRSQPPANAGSASNGGA